MRRRFLNISGAFMSLGGYIPLEYFMYGGIGFCFAWLTALMVMPAVHNRAVRLARKRYDELPLSMQEIRAEKDTIRAGFAAATCELELRIAQLRDKTAAHATDLAKKTQLIERLKQEIETSSGAMRESEAREQAARDELREVKRVLIDKDAAMGSTEGEIASVRRELANKETALLAAEREITSITGQLVAANARLGTAEGELASVRKELAGRDAALTAAERQIASIKGELAGTGQAFGAAEGEIAAIRRELAGKDATLRATERELATLKSECATKDAALGLAEQEIASIKAEIAGIAPLLMQKEKAAKEAFAEFVPLAPERPRLDVLPLEAPPPPASQRLQGPLDIIPPPTRLVPPSPHNNDSFARAFAEIADAAQRVDARYEGTNQRLRATYAPLVKSSG
jgi:hypothetical protein